MEKLKALKDYALVKGELYRRMLGGILSRCVGQEEAQRKLREIHDRTCGFYREVNLYRKLQRSGEACQLAVDREESYVVFIGEDWRNPFVQYLAKGILSQKHS